MNLASAFIHVQQASNMGAINPGSVAARALKVLADAGIKTKGRTDQNEFGDIQFFYQGRQIWGLDDM